MWRSFFFAVGIILIFIGLQCLAVQEFRIDKNNRLFAFAKRANRAIDATAGKVPQNGGGLQIQNSAGANYANQQQFSLPSSASYYGGPSRFQTSSYQSAYGGNPQLSRQSLSANSVSNTTNIGQAGFNTNLPQQRPKMLQNYPVTDWMPWGFLAAGTIISLYTNSTGRYRHSGEQ